MSSKRYFLLGLFFLAAFGLLGYFTLFKSDLKLFGSTQELSIYFPRANGLRDGDSVLVAGVRWGRVGEITFDPGASEDDRIVVRVRLDKPLVLREGYKIQIEEATLLGGRILTLDPGSPRAEPLDESATLRGVLALNPIDTLGEFVRENKDAVADSLQGMRDLVEGLQIGRGTLGRLFVDEAMADDLSRGMRSAANTFESVDRITADLAAGQGTFGRLLQDDAIYRELEQATDNLNAVLEDLRSMTADARAGRGLVGRVLGDEQLGDDVAATIADLREIMAAIRSGEGTVGMLLRDDGVGRSIDSFFKRLSDGDGLLGKLVSDEELYADVRSFSADLAATMAHVRQGRGTLGRIVIDEELYAEIMKSVKLVTRSLEEYREAAPISTMTSVIFGAF